MNAIITMHIFKSLEMHLHSAMTLHARGIPPPLLCVIFFRWSATASLERRRIHIGCIFGTFLHCVNVALTLRADMLATLTDIVMGEILTNLR